MRARCAWILALAACDSAPPPKKASPSVTSAGKAAAPPAAAQPDKKAAAEQGLRDDDFVAGPEHRDPFVSFLDEFSAPRLLAGKGPRSVLLEKFSLDELSLIAIIGGAEAPVAMFRDPQGVGVPVRRGDYISKAAAKVDKILNDRVLLEIEEPPPDKDMAPLIVRREFPLHPEGGE